eukprot:GHRR01030672.1.p2 GENE.GHRR01030672.1~~GHRR01030672.1.p2  ORF type:complete len:127 (+),score=23.63 GHRR01030672.1:482-862(+)
MQGMSLANFYNTQAGGSPGRTQLAMAKCMFAQITVYPTCKTTPTQPSYVRSIIPHRATAEPPATKESSTNRIMVVVSRAPRDAGDRKPRVASSSVTSATDSVCTPEPTCMGAVNAANRQHNLRHAV